jgi:hypothetical protein
MSMKKVYTCNICQSEKPEAEVAGFWFGTNESEPKLIMPEKTANIHICTSCQPALRFALNNRLSED